MNDDDGERQIQNDYLRRQIVAIDSLPPSDRRRKRLQLFVLRCRSCQDVVLEVVDTKPYRVIRTRRTQLNEIAPPPPGLSPEGRTAYWREHFADRPPDAIRLDARWMFTPIPDDLSSESDSSVVTACRCTSDQLVRISWLATQLAAGKSTATR